MIYRLITVWHDTEEEDPNRVRRTGRDFVSAEEVEAFVIKMCADGVTRCEPLIEPLDNGARLTSVFVPIHRISGWYVWQLPDDAPPWPIVEVTA